MQVSGRLIGIAAALVFVAGPMWLGLTGLVRARMAPARTAPAGANSGRTYPWDWQLTIASALLYTLAFNLVFFIQEFFLVLPKAFVAGLRPTLYHNNHTWEGDNPLANLLQGAGALATFCTGIGCALLLRRTLRRSTTVRLFLIWMAYNGLLQSLPQIVIGAVEPRNDVGMAMNYVHLGAGTKMAAAFAAIALIPWVGLHLIAPLVSLARDPAQIAGALGLTRFIFRAATLPALTAILLIIPFRVPRNWIEVVMVPLVVTVVGIAWIQAGAWRAGAATDKRSVAPVAIAYPLGAVLLLWLVFQVALRPGIRFHF